MVAADAAAQRLASYLSLGHGLRPSVDRACAGDVCAALLFRLMHSIAVLATPIIVFFLLEWFVDESQPEWPGYIFAAGFGAVGLIAAYAQSLSLRCSLRAGVHTRAALCALAMTRSHQLEWASVVDRSSELGLVGSPANERADDDGTASAATDRMDAVPLGRLAALIGRSSEEVLGYFAARTVVVALVLEVGGSLAVLYWLVGVAALGGMPHRA